MHCFSENFLTIDFHDTWIKNQIRRQGEKQISLRNNNDFFIERSRTAQTSNHPVATFPV